MIKRAFLMALALAACETSLPPGVDLAQETSSARPGPIINTAPESASLNHPGGTCLTPCRVDYLQKTRVILGKEGYKPIILNVPPGAADITLEMEPVGRSSPVEELGLPDL